MLLIHVPRLTNRLGYTLNVLFHYILKTDFEITVDATIYDAFDGPKLCYGPRMPKDGIFLRSSDLLFRTTVEEVDPHCFIYKDIKALFPVHNQASALPFDILASAFWCLSRYEEYLPHFTDQHGRFPASASLAYREHFLSSAIVDRWALLLADVVRQKYPDVRFVQRFFDYEDTIDIDAAYCYKHKGLSRTLVGMGRDLLTVDRKSLLTKRLRTLIGKENDPFDNFDYIIGLHERHPGLRLKFFPLMADYNVYDKPIGYLNSEFRALLQHLCDYAKMGLHSSYASQTNTALVAVEAQRLSSLLHRKITRNRNHFLLLSLPKTYNTLIDNGILHDYTMGYADEPGFRAGTCTPFPFFDLESDCETRLTIHPFAAMDSTFYYYKKVQADAARQVYKQLIDEASQVGSVLSLLWHNQSFCDDFGWQGWRDLYEFVLDYSFNLKKANRKP